MRTTLFLCVGVLLLLGSCRRSVDVTCNTTAVVAIFGTGFDTTDFASGMVYKYKQDNAFDSLADSSRLVFSVRDADTLNVAVLYPGFDYKIVMPAISKTYLVTGITQGAVTHHTFTYKSGFIADHSPYICYDPVVSCYINGTLYSAGVLGNMAPDMSVMDAVYLQK